MTCQEKPTSAKSTAMDEIKSYMTAHNIVAFTPRYAFTDSGVAVSFALSSCGFQRLSKTFQMQCIAADYHRRMKCSDSNLKSC